MLRNTAAVLFISMLFLSPKPIYAMHSEFSTVADTVADNRVAYLWSSVGALLYLGVAIVPPILISVLLGNESKGLQSCVFPGSMDALVKSELHDSKVSFIAGAVFMPTAAVAILAQIWFQSKAAAVLASLLIPGALVSEFYGVINVQKTYNRVFEGLENYDHSNGCVAYLNKHEPELKTALALGYVGAIVSFVGSLVWSLAPRNL